MANLNLLAADGYRPAYEAYHLDENIFLDYCKKILKDNFGVDAMLFTEMVEGDIFTIYTSNEQDFDEEAIDKMIDAGANPEEPDELTNYLTFELAGGQDAWAEIFTTDEHTKKNTIAVHLHAGNAMEHKLTELLETALDGTREDTIININRLLKYIKGDRGKKRR